MKIFIILFTFFISLPNAFAAERLHKVVNGEKVFLTVAEENSLKVEQAAAAIEKASGDIAARIVVLKQRQLDVLAKAFLDDDKTQLQDLQNEIDDLQTQLNGE